MRRIFPQSPITNCQLRRASRAGFTLIELMIYTGLTAIIVGLFAGILITVTRIQGEQNSSVNVTQQLNFLMDSIKRNIHDSVAYSVGTNDITLTIDPNTSPVTERVITFDPIGHRILLASSSPGGAVEDQLSSINIGIDNLEFADLRQGDSAAVQITITASASTTNPLQAMSRTLQGTAAPFVQAQ